MQEPSSFVYNTMIKGYIQSSQPNMAYQIYVEMQKNGEFGDNYTYPILLKGCGMKNGLVKVKQIHGVVVKLGFDSDVFVVNGLICMYNKNGDMGCGKAVFDGFCYKDLVSWNSMLSGFVGFGEIEVAQKLFDEMPERDVVSWSIMVDAYAKKLGDIGRARELFDTMPTRDLVSWNSMINAYAKLGKMVEARELFNIMPKKNVISWSIIIDGYAQHGGSMEALQIFNQMLSQGYKPDKVSMVGAIMACAQMGALEQGKWIHTFMKKHKIRTDTIVETALVDMYMKCGRVEDARTVFNDMMGKNVISWNVMIGGLGMNGFGKTALEYFSQMKKEQVLVDNLIFVAILHACSHAGLVNEGISIFNSMKQNYDIDPTLEHYGCLVDLYGRAGKLSEAQNVIENMPMEPNSALWGSLLLACRTHKNVAMAEIVLEKLKEIETDDCGVYVLMSNLYADLCMWDGVRMIRKLMSDRNMKKETGKSVIEVDGNVKEFCCGEKFWIQNEDMRIIVSSFGNLEYMGSTRQY